MKKTAILFILILLPMVLFCGCENKKNDSSVPEKALILNVDYKEVKPNTSIKLNAEYPNLGWSLSWVSSDRSVATVEDDGTVRFLRTGTVYITAKYGTGFSYGLSELESTARFLVTQSPSENSSDNDKPKVWLNFYYDAVLLGDKRKLQYSVTGMEDYKTEWTASKSENVSINDGVIEFMKSGTVYITVKCYNGENSAEATARFYADVGVHSAELFVENKSGDVWDLPLEETFEIKPFIFFNSRKFYDLEIIIECEDNEVLDVIENVINPKAQGNVQLVIKSFWRGLSWEASKHKMIKTMTVNVV